ncbi:hypothetical protein JCM17960_14040 [Magnetospira thiophila]
MAENPAPLALDQIYQNRFDAEDRVAMRAVWRVLVDHFFQRWVKPTDAVLDVGAGLCNFINQVKAARRVAMDADPTTGSRCDPGVAFIHAQSLEACQEAGPFDVVFMSNLLEHLPSGEAVLEYLRETRRLLKPGGRVMILQPNFALVGAAYFDFIDHKTILTDKSLVEALELSGFEVEYLKRRFLPYTSKSSIPRAPWMVRLYLALPPVQFLMGQQSFVVARPVALASDASRPI